ncbi:MAG TPA: DNA polymerase I [Burkholderiaceae bacterium]|nr:DNA polymerase I [Burkholderiaceae bacterium]
MTDKTLLLVDGSSFLYRAFHALPDLRNKQGEPTGAIYGMVGMLRRLRGDPKLSGDATHGAVVFDAPGKTFRDEWYPEYKANRAQMPDDLSAQIPVIHDVVRALGWPLLMLDGIEADDVIATLARQASAQQMRTVVSTGDKDLAQLVSDQVILVNTMAREGMPVERLDRDAVIAKFGVPPERIVDYLTLVGDSVDNVPGVPKVGPKTAAKWLNQYGTLDAIVAQAGSIGGAVGENLRKTLDWLPTARRLVTVKDDCDLSAHVASIDALDLRAPDDLKLRELYARSGFRTWLREIDDRLGSLGLDAGGGGRAGAGGASGGGAARRDVLPRRSLEGAVRGGGQTAEEAAAALATAAASDAPAGVISADGLEERLGGGPGEGLGERLGEGGELALVDDPASVGAAAAPAFAPDYECVTTEEALERWCGWLDAAELTALDTETTSLDPMAAELVGIALSVRAGQGGYIPLAHRYAGAPDMLSAERVLERLRGWLEDPAKKKVGQHLKYDTHVFANYGIRLAGVEHDTLLESYVLEAHRNHDMDSMALRHLNRRTLAYDDVTGKGAARIPFEQVALDRATCYAAEDAEVTLALHHALYPRIAADAKLHYVYHGIELPTAAVLQQMEHNGVLIDAELMTAQSAELGRRMMELEKQAYEAAGQPFNLGSPKQIGELLFDKMKLPVVKKTASGAPSTDEEVLAKLALDYPLPRIVLDHRGLSKLKSTYTDKLPRMVNPRTGRVHTSYGQAIAVTGRLSSNEPNLQNIPIRTAEGRRIREAFIAPPGSLIMSADYSQIELRIMAHISEDEGLMRAFSEGLDVHRATASEVFGVPMPEVTSEQRRYAKVINFGLIYGMSAFGLASNLGIERDAAKRYIERYFARYPGVANYMEQTRLGAKQQGYVETVFGRRLWLSEINSPNGPRRQAAERAAINAPMQGTAADLIKLSMIAVQRWLTGQSMSTRLIMQVHDELVFEVPEAELDTVRENVTQLMTGVAALRVLLEVGVGVGPNWDRAH